MAERKHADLWRELVDEAGDDAIDRAASVGVEQAEAELKAAGFDVAGERAKAHALVDALEAERPRTAPRIAPPMTPRPARAADENLRARRRPAVTWLAAAATMGGLAGGATVLAFAQRPWIESGARTPASSHSASVAPSAADLAAAADVRRRAAAACDAKQWGLCLAHLDEARGIDPGGDDAPVVKVLRAEAIARIVQKPGPPSP